jgi:hypothetical protein
MDEDEEECEQSKIYKDILENGLKDKEYKKKFEDFINSITDNIQQLKDYAEVDCDLWGNPYV